MSFLLSQECQIWVYCGHYCSVAISRWRFEPTLCIVRQGFTLMGSLLPSTLWNHRVCIKPSCVSSLVFVGMSHKCSDLLRETLVCQFVHESKIYECTDHTTDLPRVTAELALEIIMNPRYEVQLMYQIVSCSREVPSEHLQVNRTAAFTRVMSADQHSNMTNT